MIIMYMMRATNNNYKNDNDNQDRNMYFVQSRIYSRAWLCRTSAMRKKNWCVKFTSLKRKKMCPSLRAFLNTIFLK